jgi:uncharacterized radical SAM superfamily protein
MKIFDPAGGTAVFSVTGPKCGLACQHCGGYYLKGMRPLLKGQMRDIAPCLKNEGYYSVLISGGCSPNGSIPLDGFYEDIRAAKGAGLAVNVHTGILRGSASAQGLAAAGVDRVSLDIVGDATVAKKIYGFKVDEGDYAASLDSLLAAGLHVSPHVIVGLDYGTVGSQEGGSAHEFAAIELISSQEAAYGALLGPTVLLILMPTKGTSMESVEPPALDDVARVFRAAGERLKNGWTLGCMRPRKDRAYAHAVEVMAVKNGASGIVGATPATLAWLKREGIAVEREKGCCVL